VPQVSNPQRAAIALTTTLGAPSAGGGCQRAPHADLQGVDACLPARQTPAAHDCAPLPQAARGAFKSTTPDDLLLAVLRATTVQSGVAPSEVQDIAVGNVQLSGAYAGPARMSMLRAGFPASVPLYTVNRQCSSGLQAVANIAASIRSGSISTGIAAGVESMSFGGAVGGGELPPANWNEIQANPLARECLVPMGMTAENVAERYGVTRAEQDAMAVDSHTKAL
jgi:acetyl-CoA acyltransferase 1